MSKQILEEGINNVLLFLFGEYMGSGVVIFLLISSLLAYRVRSKLKIVNKRTPQLSDIATILSIGIGILIFVGLLAAQAIIHHYAVSLAQERDKVEKSSPENQKRTLRAWLDKLGYASHEEEAKDNVLFRIEVTGKDINFALSQEKDRPGILILETKVDPKRWLRLLGQCRQFLKWRLADC